MPGKDKKSSGGSILPKIFLAWFISYIYSCTPERWTSVKRVYVETFNRALMPLIPLFPMISIDGTLLEADPKELLPHEAHAPYVIIPADTPMEKALTSLRHSWERQDAIVVWKGFASGTIMDKWRDEDFCRNTFNDDSYEFLTNSSNLIYETKNLKSAIDNMEDHYLGFSYTLLNNNKDTLLSDFLTMLKNKGEEATSLIPVFKSIHHAFLYKGKKYHTGVHQAPVSDWFFQISNAKTWRFVHPKYTPYMKPFSYDGVSMMSRYDYLPDDCGIPYVDVTTDEGDLMFFPAHWWHEVHNNGDEWGLAFGFRPKADIFKAIRDVVFPPGANTGLVSHRMLFFMGKIKTAFLSKMKLNAGDTMNKNSGIKGRIAQMKKITDDVQRYVPGWTWDNFPDFKPTGTPGSCSA